MRVLGQSAQVARLSPGQKSLIFVALLLLLTALVAWIDPRPTLRHVNLKVLSGSPAGNYHAIVERLAGEVARRHGRVQNLSSAGSVENVQRLIGGKASCEVHFALVQDGVSIPPDSGLELLGRLPRPESLLILGREAEKVRTPTDLAGLRIGIGPVGSGTEQLMRRLLLQVQELELVVSTQPIDQQLDLLERGELDLGAMVIDEDARLVRDAVGKRKLQILDMPDAGALARWLPFARVGIIESGQIDYVRKIPAGPKRVLQVDTLVLSNGCASNGAMQGLLTALAKIAPTFIRHNKAQTNLTDLPTSTVAENFYRDEGADLLGTYAPWAVSIMPLPTWIQFGVALSLLFSAMGLWHRYNLWRVDANRVKIEREIPAIFMAGVTVGEIADMTPDARHRTPETRAQIDDLIARLVALSQRCRKQSLSVLVPMGEEMSYRYQETLIADLLQSLRLYHERLVLPPGPRAGPT
ncbi:MAG: TAXI family TRAP transporter solute-binding subunit [Rubrivivax sp.]